MNFVALALKKVHIYTHTKEQNSCNFSLKMKKKTRMIITSEEYDNVKMYLNIIRM